MSKAGCPVPYLYSWNLTMLLQNGHINQYLNELFRTRDASCLKGKKMGIEIGKKFKNVLKELEVWGNEYIVR